MLIAIGATIVTFTGAAAIALIGGGIIVKLERKWFCEKSER